jgi:hypothetical protein
MGGRRIGVGRWGLTSAGKIMGRTEPVPPLGKPNSNALCKANPHVSGSMAVGRRLPEKTGAKEPDAKGAKEEKQNQLDQRGNTFWEPIELVEGPYSSADSSSTSFFGILN